MLSYLFRFFLIFVAISVARSVIMAILGALRGPKTPSKREASPRTAEAEGEGSASTLLHQDPVCGTYVAAASSLRKISAGKVYHFCSEECRNRFS
jgi:YHS domain-containing protein